MHQLKCGTINNSLSMLFLNPLFITSFLLFNSFLEHSELILLSNDLLAVLLYSSWTISIFNFFIQLFGFDRFHFTMQFFHRIISELWYDLKHHVSHIWNVRAMQFRTLLNLDFRSIKSYRRNISVDRITIEQDLITVLQKIVFHKVLTNN